MTALDDVIALGYTATPTFQGDGFTVYRIEGFNLPLTTVRDDSPELQSIVDLHPQRQAQAARETNRGALTQKLIAARQVFRDNYTNWATLTNAQKDAANRNAQRALANLVQIALDQLDDQGV